MGLPLALDNEALNFFLMLLVVIESARNGVTVETRERAQNSIDVSVVEPEIDDRTDGNSRSFDNWLAATNSRIPHNAPGRGMS